jgi:hypothetical protein
MSLLSKLLFFTLGFAFSSLLYSYWYILFHSNDNSTAFTDLKKEEKGNDGVSSNNSLHPRPHPADGSPSSSFSSNASSILSDSLFRKEDKCSILNLHSLSPSYIWNRNLDQVFLASRHLQDFKEEYKWHDFTARLLYIINTQRMQNGIKTLPKRYWDQIGYVLEIVWKRYQYVQQQSKLQQKKIQRGDPPRKLHILVMGGSVTMGVQCHNNPVEETSRFSRRNCAWPTRLEQFLNSLVSSQGEVLEDVVQVDVITLGGTNTESAIKIWEYSLFPENMPHPDIIIHGYATNDMHVLSEREAMEKGISLEEMILQVNQNFVRTVLKPQLNCQDRPPPLLLYFDDYLGNEQREILKTGAFSRAAQMLSTYYGFGLISYADVVRHLVYGDTTEEWFSPSEWPKRQVHPGMGMHISSMWTMAFYFLHVASVYCSGVNGIGNSDDGRADNKGEENYIPGNGLPVLRDKNKILLGEPRRTPKILPPVLDHLTSLDTISTKWQELEASSSFSTDTNKCDLAAQSLERRRKPCVFSWVSGLERKFDKRSHLDGRMKPVLLSNHGWGSVEDSGKLGFQANKGTGSMFEMKVKADVLKIQTLNFMVMTSYGEKWKDSMIHVEAFVDRYGQISSPGSDPVKHLDIQGFHYRNTSETYNYKLDLEEHFVQPNDVLRVRVELKSGSTFKFMGMAFCDH